MNFSIYYIDLWKWFSKNRLIDILPNLNIVLKIYLTIQISNSSTERAFLKFNIVKNKNRTIRNQENLPALMILASENDIFQTNNSMAVIEQKKKI